MCRILHRVNLSLDAVKKQYIPAHLSEWQRFRFGLEQKCPLFMFFVIFLVVQFILLNFVAETNERD